MIRRRTYNPSHLTGEELKASFLARHENLEEMLRSLRTYVDCHPGEHMLLVGARGMGKTTLGLRFLQSVAEDPVLAMKWQPVPFYEENYDIASLADFWLASLRHLSRATADDRWRQKSDELTQHEPDQSRRESYALASLLDYCNASGRRLVLFVENLDLVFQQIGDERETHALRGVLIEHSELLLVGSANALFDAVRSQSAPFYEFFRIITLNGLEREQCGKLFESIVEREEALDSGRFLAQEQGRLETIRELTGGNPRLLVLTARMLIESPLGSAFDDLEALIDEQTPYFKSLIEALPGQARKVFNCLAAEWTPMLAREVSVRVNLSPSHTSAQLRQLMDKGYVRERRLSAEKRTRYEVADRFYNLYYLLRFIQPGRLRLERLVAFLHNLYGDAGMPALYGAVLQSLRARVLSNAEFVDWVLVFAPQVSEDYAFDGRSSWLEVVFNLSIEKLGAESSVVNRLTQMIGPASIDLYVQRGITLIEANRLEKAESMLRLAIVEDRDYFALYLLALVLVQLDRVDESLEVFGEVSAGVGLENDFGRSLTISAQVERAIILQRQGHQGQAASMAEQTALLLRPEDPYVFRERYVRSTCRTGAFFWEAGRRERAVNLWKLAVQAVRIDDEAELRIFGAAVMCLWGEWLRERDQLDEACDTLRKVRTFALTSDGPELRKLALTAISTEAQVHALSERFAEATNVWLLASDYVQPDDRSEIRESAAMSLCSAGFSRSHLADQDAESLADSGEFAAMAVDLAPDNPTVMQISAQVLANVGKWGESLEMLENAVAMLRESDSLTTGMTDTLIQIAAAGHMVRVRGIMADANLTEDLEPLWHAIRLELGEQLEPLPTEVIDAANRIRTLLVHDRQQGDLATAIGHGA